MACLIESGQPFLVGRPGMGAPEDAACVVSVDDRSGATYERKNVTYYRKQTISVAKFWNGTRRRLKAENGVLTVDDSDTYDYARCYTAAMNASDLIARFGGGHKFPLRLPADSCANPGRHHHAKVDVLLAKSGHFPTNVLCETALNPWVSIIEGRAPATFSERVKDIFGWTRALAGKTVLIVHPFNTTIRTQLGRGGTAIWGSWADDIMPPTVEFKLVGAPQNVGLARENSDWREALTELLRRVEAMGYFDLALVGCGGLGMLLGAHLRATNRSAIYHGAALQTYFGIYGTRWKNEPFLRGINRTGWVRPLKAEYPIGGNLVDRHLQGGKGAAPYW